MKNAYGEQLDKNGYAPSIINQPENACAVCFRTDRPLQRHEIFHGAYRKKSKQFGLWLNVCDLCHDRIHHVDGNLDKQLKQMGQDIAQIYYGWDDADFRLIFGRSR